MGVLGVRSGEQDRAAVAVEPTPGQVAWLAALPCALVTIVAALVLGPLVGHALFEPSERLWPPEAFFVYGQPEPVEQGRFLVVLLGPALLVAAVLAGGAPRAVRLPPPTLRALVAACQAVLVVAVLVAALVQRGVVYGSNPDSVWAIFTPATYAVASALLVLACVPRVRRPVADLLRRDGRGVRAGCTALAVAATALWLTPAIVTEVAVATSPFVDLPPWAMADSLAVLNGRTPLVEFHAFYGQLWGYVGAVPMLLLGDTNGVFSVSMACGSALALLALYVILRRVLGSALHALALYLPLLATSLFAVMPPDSTVILSNSQIYSVWPMRYGGPLLLAWLTVRHLGGAVPRRLWPLFLVAGLVVLNNLEFGLGALAGTLAAVACAPPTWSRAGLRRLAVATAAGLLGAVLLVVLLTLAHGGALPRFGLVMEFPRLFGTVGLAALPTPVVGFHLVVYATLAAAMAVAAVRARRRDPDLALTGMLAWSGVFGLGAASYFMGRADQFKLAALFPAWGLALALLLVVVLRALAARDWRRPSPAELLVLFGGALMVCSLAQLPWLPRELERLRPAEATAVYAQPDAHEFLDRSTRPGEHVAILIPMGHRIAHDVGIVNVSPYVFLHSIVTRRQWRTVIDAMREEGARKLYVLDDNLAPMHRRAFAAWGLRRGARFRQYAYWVDGGS